MEAWFRVDPTLREPLFAQLVFRVKEALARGELRAGDRLPSVRDLAQALAINPNTVSRAYARLAEEGLLVRRQGTGCFVGEGGAPSEVAERALAQALHRAVVEARNAGLTREHLRAALERALGGENHRRRTA